MNDTTFPSATGRTDRLWLRATFLVLGCLLVWRVGLVLASPLNLYADEAQYWRWGQDLAWGYYSKPPMIAWVIHLTTALFGTSEPAVRIAAPVLHTVAAAFLFLLGRAIYGVRAGFFAALLYALMPAVSLSSAVISTDGVLMPFFAAGLYLLWRLRTGKGGLASAAALGLAIGGGVLAKYAMLYFVIGVGLAVLADPPTRRAMLSAKGAAAAGLAILIIAPHFAWNAANDFATVSHTVDNANLSGDLFNPENAGEFFTDQLGVFGPVSFLLLLAATASAARRAGGPQPETRWLLLFILPVLAFILVQAVVSRAHANWAATAYPAASVLLAGWLARQLQRPAWLWAAAAVNLLIALLLTATALLPASLTSALGADNALKRTRGWDAAAQAIFAEAERLGATAILVDEREVWHGLDFYGRHESIPIISWRRYPAPKSFSEQRPLEGLLARRVLVASVHEDLRPHLRGDFAQFEPAGQVRIPLGRRRNGCEIERVFQLYLASGYAPPERTLAWEARFAGRVEFAEPPCPAPR